VPSTVGILVPDFHPLGYQTNYALVCYSVLYKLDKPVVVDCVEEFPDVEIKYPVYFLADESDVQCI